MKPFSATLAALALVSAAHADVKSELQGRYAALSKAFKSRDVKIYEATLADGYVLEAMGRKVDRAAIISDFKRQMNIMKTKEWSRTIVSV
ncbi:hypothetical protein, partial [Enterococcus lactis]|uniref:hypothetical protein n=1 Tax=Enterococcus lactis TaxID=357441 RepID=UPI0034E9643F